MGVATGWLRLGGGGGGGGVTTTEGAATGGPTWIDGAETGGAVLMRCAQAATFKIDSTTADPMMRRAIIRTLPWLRAAREF
jgi:hypothetical protein